MFVNHPPIGKFVKLYFLFAPEPPFTKQRASAFTNTLAFGRKPRTHRAKDLSHGKPVRASRLPAYPWEYSYLCRIRQTPSLRRILAYKEAYVARRGDVDADSVAILYAVWLSIIDHALTVVLRLFQIGTGAVVAVLTATNNRLRPRVALS